MRFRVISAALACVFATHAAAQTRAAPALAVDQDHTIAAQQRAFAEWSVRFNTAFDIGQQGVMPVQAAIQQVFASNASPAAIASARKIVADARAAIVRSTAVLEAMDLPIFDLLGIPDEVAAPALMRSALALNATRLKLLDNTTALLDGAARRDIRAVAAANGRILALSQEMLAGTLPVVKARALALPEGSTDRAYYLILGIIYRGYLANYAAISPTGVVHAGPEFAAKAEALAQEGEAIVAASEKASQRDLARTEQLYAEARANGNPAQIAFYDRQRRAFAAADAMFAQGRLLVAELRGEAAGARKGGQTALLMSGNVKRLKAFEYSVVACQQQAMQILANLPTS